MLNCEGNTALLAQYALAIVGSRSLTPTGLETARAFAAQLSWIGLCVMSGLVLGIDAAAHQGCLDAGGSTLVVVGTGLDRVYPARHAELAKQIRDYGLLFTEYPLGTPPLDRYFP